MKSTWRELTLYLIAALLGYAIAALAQQAPTPWSVSVYQVNATTWAAEVSGGLGYSIEASAWSLAAGGSGSASTAISAASWPPGPSPSTSVSVGTSAVAWSPGPRLGASATVVLELQVGYGGAFHVNRTWVMNPIAPGEVGAGKAFAINVTVWSPYGTITQLLVNISDLAKYVYNGSLYEVYDPFNLFEPVNYSLTVSGGWVYFTLELRPSWAAGGPHDVWVYAEDVEHGYNDTNTYAALFKVDNTTILYSYQLDKSRYKPGEPGRLELMVTYNSTDVGAVGEEVWVNGSPIFTDENGMAIYEFTAPPASGMYVLNITLAHGGTYFVNFSVSEVMLHLKLRTQENETLHLRDVVVEVYNYTTMKPVATYVGGEDVDIPLNASGEYLIRVYHRGALIAETVHTQTEGEQVLILPVIKHVIDHLGKLRGILCNTSILSYSFDNATRKLHVVVNGSDVARLIYLVNYTKPLLVLSNTTLVGVQHLEGEVVIDTEAPAELTIVDPRRFRVTVVNPLGIPLTPLIEFLNGTSWIQLVNDTTYEVPASTRASVRATFKGVEALKDIQLTDDVNVTLYLWYTAISDYRGMMRELISNATITYQSLSPRFPYSQLRVLVTGHGPFRLRLNYTEPPTRVVVVSNASITWQVEGSILTIEGELHSTAEINVTDQYLLEVKLYDRLGNPLPVSVVVYVNGTSHIGIGSVGLYVAPATYLIEVPEEATGFILHSLEGRNSTITIVEVNATDVTLEAWYRVPTVIRGLEIKQIENGVIVIGTLEDYYGAPVVNRTVIVTVQRKGGGSQQSLTAITDGEGLFRAGLFTVERGVEYVVNVAYGGDDTYVESSASTTFIIPATSPRVGYWPPDWVIITVAAVIIVVAMVIIASKIGAVKSELTQLYLEDEFVGS